jgi:hypothetical protein
MFTGLKLVFTFFRNPENQHLATWIQTIAIVGGVIVALNQLDTITKQEQIKSNEKYMQLAQKYSKVVHSELNRVLKHHSHSKSLDITEFNERYPKGSILKSREVLEDYFAELSLCGILEVCPKKLVDSLVCSQSKVLYSTLKKELKSPDGKIIRSMPPFFYERKINIHCSIFDRAVFWVNA